MANLIKSVTDKETGEVISIPEIMQPADGLLIPVQPIDVRAMTKGHGGHFSIGGNTNEGNVLEVQVFNYKKIEGIRPSEEYAEPTNFIQLVGLVKIGSRRALSTVTFSSSSVDRIIDAISVLALKGGSIANILLISLLPTQNKKGQKFSVAECKMRPATKDEIADVKNCVEFQPSSLNAFRELPNIDNQSNG